MAAVFARMSRLGFGCCALLLASGLACTGETPRELDPSAQLEPQREDWAHNESVPSIDECATFSERPAPGVCLARYEHERGGDTFLNPRSPGFNPFVLCEGDPRLTIGRGAAACLIQAATRAKPQAPWSIGFGSSAYTVPGDRSCYWVGMRDTSNPACNLEVVLVNATTGEIEWHALTSAGVP